MAELKIKKPVHPEFGTIVQLAQDIERSQAQGTYPETWHVAAVAWFIQQMANPKRVVE